MPAKTIMIQGTGSNVGKSIIVTALCRIFAQDGYRTAPFKSQNMSLNSFATGDGKEIGMAQAVQAEAAQIEPAVDMNPILLKPSSSFGAQVIIKGKPVGHMPASEYIKSKHKFLNIVEESLGNLVNTFDVVVIEGAGSPAEINLKDHDIVNMKIAELANAPVIIVGDIDRGGVFASLVGTLELLEPEERERVKGFIINKFRGDRGILQKGLDMLEKRTGVPVLGVLPYFTDISIYAEDSLSLNALGNHNNALLKISVIKLPMISNFTDFEPLKHERDVDLRFVTDKAVLADSDVIIIPGTKNTMDDLLFLRSNGFAAMVEECAKNNIMIVGICGGFQMLGKVIYDSLEVESKSREVKGLGLLNIETYFKPTKITEQIEAVSTIYGDSVRGYEIHMGETVLTNGSCLPMFQIIFRGDRPVNISDGAVNKNRTVWGTYIHGIFENDSFRKGFLDKLRKKKGIQEGTEKKMNKNSEYNKLAELVRQHIPINTIPFSP